VVKHLALIAIACGACGTFEDPDVVIDLRILSITADPPEQVIDISQTQEPLQLVKQLVPAKVCALVADPNFDRRLRYTLTVCNLGSGERCDLAAPHVVLADTLADDPDLTVPEPQLCATIPADLDLMAIILTALDVDSLHGLGGVYYGVELKIGGETADPALDLYASKNLVVQPKIPDTRTANQNPTLSGIQATIDGGLDSPVDLHRCADNPNPVALTPGQKVRFTPIEPDGAREVYTVPTLDGMFRTFTESLTYQWVLGDGHVSNDSTGGPHDPFGNPAPLFTDFTAPSADALMAMPEDIPLWVIQRDERLGAAWFETCIRVTP